ncbi:helix-turn-helix transcriptional regulator [Micromonospora sp. KC606]|uniref:helix-turn-helix transcriptional regulator n=1 Tax=Micromonospora sp. KC606 TaxID=2530379 RepID=UPI001404F404|nr:helix-turn-helix transcriptional regulator [Micromonospora sp. KC606]
MEDFASGVLVSAVWHVLAEEGLAPAVPQPSGVLVPLEVKRRLLVDVAAAHGLLPLLRVGLALPRLPSHPISSALRAADSPFDLFSRWKKLERFAHSRHRVVVRQAASTCVVADHVGPPGSPPHPAEDALVLGVLAALLGDVGARGLTVTLGPALVVFADGVFTAPSPDYDTARWRFTWSSHVPPARPALPVSGGDLTGRSRALLATDPVRRWTVGDLAAEAAVSVRTLQRQLRPAGGFAALLGAVRADRAANLLVASAHPLGVIGFICGYADQPHFTRDFRRRTAMTPAAYRSAFATHSPPTDTSQPAEATLT